MAGPTDRSLSGDEFGVLTTILRENGKAATAAIREVSGKIDATNEHLVATNERLDATGDRLDRTNERLDAVVETSAQTRERLAKLEGHLLRSPTPPAMKATPQPPPMRPKADSTGEIVLQAPAPGQTLELSIGGTKKPSIWTREPLKSALKYGMVALIPTVVGLLTGWFGHASAAAPSAAAAETHPSTIALPPSPVATVEEAAPPTPSTSASVRATVPGRR